VKFLHSKIAALRHSKNVKFYSTTWQQIRSTVVDFIPAISRFITKCNRKEIIKIGPHLPKVLVLNERAMKEAHSECTTYEFYLTSQSFWSYRPV